MDSCRGSAACGGLGCDSTDGTCAEEIGGCDEIVGMPLFIPC